jgi:hypothetical protein
VEGGGGGGEAGKRVECKCVPLGQGIQGPSLMVRVPVPGWHPAGGWVGVGGKEESWM